MHKGVVIPSVQPGYLGVAFHVRHIFTCTRPTSRRKRWPCRRWVRSSPARSAPGIPMSPPTSTSAGGSTSGSTAEVKASHPRIPRRRLRHLRHPRPRPRDRLRPPPRRHVATTIPRAVRAVRAAQGRSTVGPPGECRQEGGVPRSLDAAHRLLARPRPPPSTSRWNRRRATPVRHRPIRAGLPARPSPDRGGRPVRRGLHEFVPSCTGTRTRTATPPCRG